MIQEIRRIRRRPLPVVIVVVPLLAAACSSGSGLPEIGMRRASVNLQFTNAAASTPTPATTVPTPAQALAQAPALPVPVQASVGFAAVPQGMPSSAPKFVPPPFRSPDAPCPALNPFGVYSIQPATNTITTPIAPGTYPLVTKGKVLLSLATQSIPINEPSQGTLQVLNVNEQFTPANPGSSLAGVSYGSSAAAETGTFEMKQAMGGLGSTDSYYQVTSSEIELTKRVTTIGSSTVTFTPTPALEVLPLGSGAQKNPYAAVSPAIPAWTSVGVDQSTGTIGIVQGSVVPTPQVVNACGTPVAAYEVQSSERYISVSPSGTAYTSMTDDNAPNTSNPTGPGGQPNYYFVATQLGGLTVEMETHTTTTIAPYTIKIDDTSTLASLKPKTS